MIAFTNRTFLERAYSYFDNTLAMAAFTLGLTCLLAACTIAFSVKYVQKPVLILLVLSAVAGSWFMDRRSEEHTSELQSLMRRSYAVFCLTKKNKYIKQI